MAYERLFRCFKARPIGYLCAVSTVGWIMYDQKIPVLSKENSHAKSAVGQLELPASLPTRSKLIEDLTHKQVYDVFVVGGGATGCGVALDASIKGLNVALVDRGDFAGQTSSKSTKLIHGGVRYLQNAVFKLDINEYYLVREALTERKHLMDNCPYLTNPIPIMIPIYTWWELPYYWAGLKMYDLVAGRQFFRASFMLSREKTIDEFPLIETKNLRGSVVYYDGQMDDSRLNLVLAMSSIEMGATCVNYVEVTDIVKSEDCNKIICKDLATDSVFECYAKVIVNATGPFTDSMRKMYNKDAVNICRGASGTHIILPRYFCPKSMGLLNADTSDNRVLFLLPWNDYTLAGTTDNKSPITPHPKSTQKDIDFIVKELNRFLNQNAQIQMKDIKAAWCGIRPLVVDINKVDKSNNNTEGTASISRNHVIENNGDFITIAGGKWTTYRAMAQDVMGNVVEYLDRPKTTTTDQLSATKPNRQASTIDYKLYGSKNWTRYFYISLIERYQIDPDIAEHLSIKYGMASLKLIEIATTKRGVQFHRIDEKLPFTEEEIRYCCRSEYVVKATDLIARRFRLSILDASKAKTLLPKIVDIIADELKWDKNKKKMEIQDAESYINNESGLNLIEEQLQNN